MEDGLLGFLSRSLGVKTDKLSEEMAKPGKLDELAVKLLNQGWSLRHYVRENDPELLAERIRKRMPDVTEQLHDEGRGVYDQWGWRIPEGEVWDETEKQIFREFLDELVKTRGKGFSKESEEKLNAISLPKLIKDRIVKVGFRSSDLDGLNTPEEIVGRIQKIWKSRRII